MVCVSVSVRRCLYIDDGVCPGISGETVIYFLVSVRCPGRSDVGAYSSVSDFVLALFLKECVIDNKVMCPD